MPGPIAAISGATSLPSVRAPAVKFDEVMVRAAPARPDKSSALPAARAEPSARPKVVGAAMVDRVALAQQRLDQVLKLAQSGKSFTPSELLGLQATVYRASQELDLAGKVVEKATGGIKQILQTQM